MKTKIRLIAMLTLVMLTLFIGGAAVATDVSFLNASSLITVALAPFAFVLPASLEAKMTKEEMDGIKELGVQMGKYIKEFEDEALSQKGLNDKLKTAWDEHMKTFGMTGETYKTLQDTLKTQGIELAALKEKGNGGGNVKTLLGVVQDWVKSPEYQANIGRGAKDVNLPALHIKAATPMSVTATTIGTSNATAHYPQAPELFNMEIDRTIYEAPREQPFLFNLVAKGSTNAVVIIWFNRVNRQGGAAFIPEFGIKPLMSWGHERETASPMKIAVGVKVSTEMLNDADYIAGEIRTVLNSDLWEKIDARVLTFLTDKATAYQGTGLDGKIPTPNDADAIRASILQMRNVKCKPNALIVTPTTRAMLDLTKSSQGNYIKQEVDALLKSLTIYESTELTEDDDFILLDTSKIKGKFKGDVTISTGWGINKVSEENGGYRSDYEMNAVTMLIERELFLYMNSLDEVAIIKDSLSVVKEAITKA